MSLIKIPCIFAVSTAFHVTFTPPSTASTRDHLPITTAEAIFINFLTELLPLNKAAFWAVGILEIATILAQAFPTSSASDLIFSLLPSFSGKDASQLNLRLTPLAFVGFIFVVSGGLLRYQCYRILKDFFTFQFTIRTNHSLVTNGPYSIVRHPSYTAILMVYIGMICWHAWPGSWVRESGIMQTAWGWFFRVYTTIQFGVYTSLLKRMGREDEVLEKTFGKEWREWAERVKYSVIPGVY